MLTADRDARGALRTEVGPGKRDRFRSRGGPGSRNFPEICRHDGRATYEDFCSLAATLVALTWATARTVVLAATANIFLCDDEVGCVNGDRERNPPRKKRVRCQLTKLHKQLAGRWSTANQNSA